MSKYPHLTKEFLFNELLTKKKSLAQVSAEQGCAKMTLIRWCKKYKIYDDIRKANNRYHVLVLGGPHDLKGKTFGSLTVLELGPNDTHGKRRWLCRCVCGRTKLINACSLKRGLSKSCGYCLISKPGFKGYKTISGSYFRRMKANAEERNLDFDITAEDIYNLWLKQDKRCALSGVDIFFCTNQDKSLQTASVDRIDNTRGYTKDNIQIVHKRINKIKLTLDNEEFIFWCNCVAKTHVNFRQYDVEQIKWYDGHRN